MTRRTIITAVAAAAVVLSSASCGKMVRESRSPMRLVLLNLRGASGASVSPTFTDYVLSDVVTNGSVFNDVGQVILRVQPRDVGPDPENPIAPTGNNQVTITRYRVVYVRADGRNTPGVDVPYPFDGGMTITVSFGQDRTGSFELVRHAAKMEPPLAPLAYNNTVIHAIAEITFYAHDQVGNELSVTGLLSIEFGNFADPAGAA